MDLKTGQAVGSVQLLLPQCVDCKREQPCPPLIVLAAFDKVCRGDNKVLPKR